MSFERFENRKLLAADLITGGAPEVEPTDLKVVPCMVASAEFPEETVDSIESTEEIQPTELDPRSLNLADGIDGYFGSIKAENPAETL